MNHMLEELNPIPGSRLFNLSDDSSISLHDLLRTLSGKSIHVTPKIISRFFFLIPFLKQPLLKLYGNFVIDNSKLQNEMGVKLFSTRQSLIIDETK